MLSIFEKYSLLDKNSFGVPAICDFFCPVSSVEELKESVRHAQSQKLQIFILAGGTNLILGKHVPGSVIHIQIDGKEVLQETEDTVYLRIGAGENWHQLVTWTLNSGFFGLENLALIPGSCGAAPVQNIGAYGT